MVLLNTQPPGTSGAVVASTGMAVATRENSGPVSGMANVGIRRAEIKQGKTIAIELTLCATCTYTCIYMNVWVEYILVCHFLSNSLEIGLHCTYLCWITVTYAV